MRAGALLATLLAGAALVGCVGMAEQPAPVATESDLAGQACRAEPRRGQARGETPFLDISCGESSRTAGSVAQLGALRGVPADARAREAFFVRALTSSGPMRSLGARAT